MFVVGYVLNQIQSSASLPKIFTIVGLLALLSFACHLVNILLKNCFFPRSDLKIQSHFMKLAFDKAREVDLECYENAEYFERHIKALNALKSRPGMVLDSIELLFGALFGFLALSGLALSLDMFMIFFIGLQIIANFVFARKENNERRAYEVELAKANRQADYIRRVHYMPEYAKELRTTNISDVLFGRFITATQNGIKVIQKHGLKCAIYRLFVDAVCTRMGYYLVILFAAFRILVLRNMMVGDGLMVVMAMFSVTEALLDQENSFFQLHEHAMYIGDLKDFLDYEPQIREDGTGAAVPVPVEEFRVQNLSFSYFGGHRKVINDISFTVKGGQTVAIVGHNGAGKSTLVKLLMRLYGPTSGKIYLNGREISEYKLSAYRNSFSTVKAGIAENFCDVSVPLLREYDKDGRLVSGGEAQKIAIARAFLKDPHTYILDEPSSALDPISEYNLNQTLFELSKDRTVIFISHRLSTTRMAEQIYMMEQGRIIEEGNHEELLARGGRYAEMFEKQAEKYQEK